MAQYDFTRNIKTAAATSEKSNAASMREARQAAARAQQTSTARTTQASATRTTQTSSARTTQASATRTAQASTARTTQTSARTTQTSTARTQSTERMSYRSESASSYRRQVQDPVAMGKLSIIEGSAARQLANPERRERPFDDRETARRKASNARRLPMNVPTVLALSFSVICLAALTIVYLNLRNDVTVSSKNVVALEKQYNQLAEDNSKLELSIYPLTDYSYIYKVATQELGMQTATADQIKQFEAQDSEYVVQYDSIPGSEN